MPLGNWKVRPIIVPVGPSIAYVELTKEMYALIDIEDAAEAGRHNWSAQRNRNSGAYYAHTNTGWPNRYSLFLHQLILGIERGSKLTGDHRIPENTLDCRRCNLRIANRRQQTLNQGISTRNKTGFKGVCEVKGGGFRAGINAPGGKRYLGTHPTAELAAEVYDAEAIKLHGEFARTNKMIKEGL